MKFSLTFKHPDALKQITGSVKDEKEKRKLAEKYVEWGEYVTIDFDTEDGTAVVREVP